MSEDTTAVKRLIDAPAERVIFAVSSDGNRLEHLDGSPLNDAETRMIGQIVASSASAWKDLHSRGELDRLLTGAVWTRPQTRREVYSSGKCVYFIRHHNGRRIKIGWTGNLANRSRRLSEQGEIIAFVKTPEAHVLEVVLHRIFRAVRFGRTEWFAAGAVEFWLKRVAR